MKTTNTQQKEMAIHEYFHKYKTMLVNKQTVNTMGIYKNDMLVFEGLLYKEVVKYLNDEGIDITLKQLKKAISNTVNRANRKNGSALVNDVIEITLTLLQGTDYTLYRLIDVDTYDIEALAYINYDIDLTSYKVE